MNALSLIVFLAQGHCAWAFSMSHVTRVLRGGAIVEKGTILSRIGDSYAQSIQHNPILTKSVTAGCIFALSDYVAQRYTNSGGNNKSTSTRINKQRMAVSAAVGLFYFGPAAHYWYEWIFRALPGKTLASTLQKAALGQVAFGPTFTCIFFATSLWQTGTLSWTNWIRKIRRDFPSTWLAGAGFWPIIDLISYTYVPVQFIPLFVNICSLVWTTYLVVKSYR